MDSGDFTVVDTNKFKVLTEEHIRIEGVKEKLREIIRVYPSSTKAWQLAHEALDSLGEGGVEEKNPTTSLTDEA